MASNTYADEVPRGERFYLDQGIHSVPAVIINDRHLISGASRSRCSSRPCARLLRRPEVFPLSGRHLHE